MVFSILAGCTTINTIDSRTSSSPPRNSVPISQPPASVLLPAPGSHQIYSLSCAFACPGHFTPMDPYDVQPLCQASCSRHSVFEIEQDVAHISILFLLWVSDGPLEG